MVAEAISNEDLIADDSGAEQEDLGATDLKEPFDPAHIRISRDTPNVDSVIARLRHGEVNLAPDFQRKPGLWNDVGQSRLIESLLIRIPLPAFYMDASNDDRWVVVDGLQRLTTLKRFVIDQSLQLTDLEYLRHLEGLTFDDLPRPFQRRILESTLVVYLIEAGTPEKVKFNIFRRINTGGLPLSAQEIRHALNQGNATVLLGQLATSSEFLRATGSSIRPDRMADREFVLRFLAFAITQYTQYTSDDFDDFLNKAMNTVNGLDDEAIESLRQRFVTSMEVCFQLFGDAGFRKWSPFRRLPVNKALFEALSVNIDALSANQRAILLTMRDKAQDMRIDLLNNGDFSSAISTGTGSIANVNTRFRMVSQALARILK